MTGPTTEAGRRLFTDNEPMDMLESDAVTWGDVLAIEAEARADALREVRARLLDLQDWLMHPDRAYSPHEIATYAHDEISAALALAAAEEAAPLDVERLARAVKALDWEPFWTETDRNADGMIEITFDNERFAERLAREYAALRSPDTETAGEAGDGL